MKWLWHVEVVARCFCPSWNHLLPLTKEQFCLYSGGATSYCAHHFMLPHWISCENVKIFKQRLQQKERISTDFTFPKWLMDFWSQVIHNGKWWLSEWCLRIIFFNQWNSLYLAFSFLLCANSSDFAGLRNNTVPSQKTIQHIHLQIVDKK